MNFYGCTGRLTATPTLKATTNGKNVCSFTLAVERRFKGSDGKPIVDFIDFCAWEKQAEFLCKWFDKGVKVAITGELQTRTFTDKDGKNRKVTEVLVSTVEFADGKREANTSAGDSAAVENNNSAFSDVDEFMPIDIDDESLPFN